MFLSVLLGFGLTKESPSEIKLLGAFFFPLLQISNYCKYSDFSRITPEFKKEKHNHQPKNPKQATTKKKTRLFVMNCEEKYPWHNVQKMKYEASGNFPSPLEHK